MEIHLTFYFLLNFLIIYRKEGNIVMPNINGEIEKLEINERIGFTGPMMTGQLMQIKAKINEQKMNAQE